MRQKNQRITGRSTTPSDDETFSDEPPSSKEDEPSVKDVSSSQDETSPQEDKESSVKERTLELPLSAGKEAGEPSFVLVHANNKVADKAIKIMIDNFFINKLL